MSTVQVRSAMSEIAAAWRLGTFHIDAVFEDDERYAVEYGSREFLVDMDPRFMALDVPIAVIDKSSGAVSFVTRDEFREMDLVES